VCKKEFVVDLSTSYLNLHLKNPFMLGASPISEDLDRVRRFEDAGCAALVMHSLFEEHITQTKPPSVYELDRARPEVVETFKELLALPEFPLRPGEYLEQIRRIKKAVAMPVIGSLSGSGNNSWLTYAKLMEEAGADAIELNVNKVAGSLQDSPETIELRIEELVRTLKAMIRIPVAVKLSPFYTALTSLASRLAVAGADGLVLFDRLHQPDVDIETLELMPNLRLSTSLELPITLRWLANLSGRVPISLAASGGVHTALDGIKALLSGAQAVQMVSAPLQQGPRQFQAMTEGLQQWMQRHEYGSVPSVSGRMNLASVPDPGDLERMAYLRILQSWPRAIQVNDVDSIPG
jgi:dihydroorotate dehydrogenase (fumarate)